MKKYLGRALVFLFAACSMVSSLQAGESVRRERVAPELDLKDLKGKTYTLSSYRNKQSVALFFLTTRCPLCPPELEKVNDLYPQLQKDDLEVLAIDVGEPASKVERFAQEHALFIPVLLDTDTSVARDYYLMGVPTIIIINKAGNIVYEGNRFPKGAYKKMIAQ
jgi:peroxiredoxin